eukprot:TRINITY_DN59887_c0_g1_i1.p1 TRINITY_DN59887_c0_g1~~TRINITY_DN59887_c0_g1_i1.p1  ORF type:complete len:217 (+),score=33.04 TRINITY_DN59887_c0_g1_i1:246-896(+)
MLNAPLNLKPEDLVDRTKAFEMFRKSYRKNEAMEENKSLLKQKFADGKKLGSELNEKRALLKNLTNKLEDLRKDNALRGLVDKNGEIIRTEEEDQLQQQISQARLYYQDQYGKLKLLKSEIERIQSLLERSKERMQKDFEQWLAVMMRQTQASSRPAPSTSAGSSQVRDPTVNESISAFYKASQELKQGLSHKQLNYSSFSSAQVFFFPLGFMHLG